jgi:hypothetical protein
MSSTGVSESIKSMREKIRSVLSPSDLRNFPFPPIESFDYTPQLVQLLTNLMAWEVIESEDLIEELLGSDVSREKWKRERVATAGAL